MILRTLLLGSALVFAGVASADNSDVEKEFQSAVERDGEIVILDEGVFDESSDRGEDFMDQDIESGDTEAGLYVFPRYYFYVTNGYGYQDCHNRVFAAGYRHSHAVASTTYVLQTAWNGWSYYYVYTPVVSYACYGAR